MIVLFSIAMVCFFALFGMMVLLLHQAMAEGARRRQQERRRMKAEKASHPSPMRAPSGAATPHFDLSLSNLVPEKRPDWRFMVREGERGGPEGSRRKRPLRYGEGRADWEFSNQDLGDLTDPQALRIARRA